jgi:lipoprotein-anchoring transpeptidase ErfK/SrfK
MRLSRVSLFAAAFSLATFLSLAPAAGADVVAHVSLSGQKMTVVVDGVERHSWPVSTARRGKHTPVGSFRPQTLVRMHYSSLYNNAPMPYSIFFHGNYAIHGTTEVSRLGRPASAGCVRLHPDHAKMLFSLVREHGAENVSIVLETGQYAGNSQLEPNG